MADSGVKSESDEKYSIFERALHSWLIIDLPSLQKSLDNEGLEIREFQKDSLISRKELSSKTKGFKKLGPEDKLTEVNPLLKSYQNEIDSLTKKNKSVESIFFNIYTALADAPDPKPLLESAIVSIGNAKELDALRKENLSLQEKLLKYADYEQLQKQLQTIEKQVDQKLVNKEKEMQSIIDAKKQDWNEKESRYEEMIEKSKKEIEELKISQQVIELKLNNQSDILDDSELNNRATNIIELEMIQRSAESSKLRVLQLEKKNDQLTKELSQLQNKDKFIDQINELNSENLRLNAKLDHEHSIINNLKRDNAKIIDGLNVEIKQLRNEVAILKERLVKTSNYDELKKELEVLKEIEFGSAGFNGDGESGDAEGHEENKLDSIIIQTNRKLNNDLVEYRSKNETLTKQLQEFEEKVKNLTSQVEQLTSLNKSLENDLSNLNNSNWDTMSVVSTISKATGPLNGRAPSIAGSISSLTDSTEPQSSSNSILPIITQQRDRFRTRNKELEDESKKQFSKIMDLKRELGHLKNDNKELYERIRYLSSYSSINQEEKRRNTSVSTPEVKYEEEYERELHPIEQFRLKESRRISSRISAVERIFISVIRLILSSPLSRYLFAAYCFGLHTVIVILFMYTTNLHMAVTADVTEGSTGGVSMGSLGDTVGNFAPQ